MTNRESADTTTFELDQALAHFYELQWDRSSDCPDRWQGQAKLGELVRQALPLADRVRGVQTLPDPDARRSRIRRSYATVAGNFARNSWRARRGHAGDLKPLYFIFSLLDSCNHRCTYCDNHKGVSHPELAARDRNKLTHSQALRLLEIMRTGVSTLFYVGGEPLMRTDLPGIMRHAGELGYFPQTLTTNGSLLLQRLTDPEWSNFLADIDVLIVSLDSVDPTVLSRMYGGDSLSKLNILRSLFMLRELSEDYQFRLVVNTVIQPGQLGHARDVLDLANAMGITFAGVPQQVAAGTIPGLLENPEYLELVSVLLERVRAGYPFTGGLRFQEAQFLDRPLQVDGEPVPCMAVLKPYIEPDGVWEVPCNHPTQTEKARLNVLDFESVDALWREANRLVDLSSYAQDCGGSCRWAQHVGANYYYYGLFHPLELWREMSDYA